MSGGWDTELQARQEVRLPELTPQQARRNEYFYSTAVEVEAKAEKLQERQHRLEAKQTKLAKVRLRQLSLMWQVSVLSLADCWLFLCGTCPNTDSLYHHWKYA